MARNFSKTSTVLAFGVRAWKQYNLCDDLFGKWNHDCAEEEIMHATDCCFGS